MVEDTRSEGGGQQKRITPHKQVMMLGKSFSSSGMMLRRKLPNAVTAHHREIRSADIVSQWLVVSSILSQTLPFVALSL